MHTCSICKNPITADQEIKGRKQCKPCRSNYAKRWYRTKGGKDFYDRQNRSPEGRYSYSKKRSSKRGFSWNIPKETYFDLIKLPCHYCSSSMEDKTGIGLDRVDNSIGYEIGNVVSCCGPCNMGKGDNFTHDEWLAAIKAIKQVRNLKF